MVKLLVLSIDAMFSSDLAQLQCRPKLAPFFQRCLTVQDMRPIYPALTYPCHASIVSGNLPSVHGVYQNLECRPNAKYQDWKWYYSEIQCQTLFDRFRKAGWSTSAIFWPVSADAPVDYLVPEIWSYTDDPVKIIKATSGGAVDHIIERHRDDVDFTSKFKLDRFAKDCALDIVDEFDPDVMFLHFSLVDHTRHGYGTHHERVQQALDQCALWLEEILDHIQDHTPTEEFSLAILGDHGHLNCRGNLSMNAYFVQQGWLSMPIPDQLKDCGAYCHSAGVSAQVYVNNKSLCPDMEAAFRHLQDEGWLFSWYNKQQAAEQGLTGPFDYVLEGGEGYFFTNAVNPSFFTPVTTKDGGPLIGKHGHLPTRGEKPPFLLSCPGMRSRQLHDHSILDIAPTLCAQFQLEQDGMQGRNLLEVQA